MKNQYGNLSEMVDSNGKVYCAITKEQAQSMDETIEITKCKNVNETKLKDVNVIQIQSWDKQAKTVDRHAIIIMPLIFATISIIYWTSFVSMG